LKRAPKQPQTSVKGTLWHPNTFPKVREIKTYPIRVGDLVEVMVGEDTGKQGKVRVMASWKNQLKVEGLNCIVEDIGDADNPMKTRIEQPLHFNEVKLVDPSTGKPGEVEYRVTDTGERVRVFVDRSVGTEEIVTPAPLEPEKERPEDVDGENDTSADVVTAQTYIPSLLLFHEEVMKEMNIPMSVKKQGLERRDLIMQEIEEEEMFLREEEEAEWEDDEDDDVEGVTKKESLLDKVKKAGSAILPNRK